CSVGYGGRLTHRASSPHRQRCVAYVRSFRMLRTVGSAWPLVAASRLSGLGRRPLLLGTRRGRCSVTEHQPSADALTRAADAERSTHVFDAEGNRTFVAPGKDTISIVDITDREAPKVLVSFPLMNSIFG